MKVGRRLSELRARLREEARRLRTRVAGNGRPATALSALVRPDLGNTPAPVRRFLEPLVAASALVVLIVLLGLGMFGFATLFLAVSLMYLIITRVFGIELGIDLAGASPTD